MRAFSRTITFVGVAACFVGLMLAKFPSLWLIAIECVVVGGFYIFLGIKSDFDADEYDRIMRDLDERFDRSNQAFLDAMDRIDPNWRARLES